MLDINGIEIVIGSTLKTQQPSGGILPSAPAQIGVVEAYKYDTFKGELCIKFKSKGQSFDSFILLEQKINEVINI